MESASTQESPFPAWLREHITGCLLAGPIRTLLIEGPSKKQALISVAIPLVLGRALLKLNRWAGRSRLRPRLEQLEQLKTEFTSSLASHLPAGETQSPPSP